MVPGAQQEKPWTSLYPVGVSDETTDVPASMLAAWAATVSRAPDAACVHLFDATLTVAEVDRASRALAGALRERAAPGDRLAIYLQNDPQWLVCLLAGWMAGLVPVAVNPMLKGEELVHHLTDSGATALVCLESLYREVVAGVLGRTPVSHVIATHALDLTPWATVPAVLRDDVGGKSPVPGTDDLAALVASTAPVADLAVPTGDDVAVLTYTSGTTGRSKGAMNLHRGMAHNARVYADWFDLDAGDTVLGIAPLFHITGLVAALGVTILTGAPLVLGHRFHPTEVLDAIERHRCTFTVASITAFVALAGDPTRPGRDLSSLTKTASGGAPISPATVARMDAELGLRIVPVYGLTETTSPTHLTPPDRDPPVDPTSGALAVGVPAPGAEVRIVGDDGTTLPPGEAGEVVVRGPMVVPGYWQLPDETAHAIRDGWLHTGDVGIVDDLGWLFLVDRKKDLINAGGYKVWPREVEDVLYTHPAVREAIVVGIPDDYRGETVKAFVSLVAGAVVTGDELIAYSRERLAAYKYPRVVEVRDELPKTVTGKLLRRALRG